MSKKNSAALASGYAEPKQAKADRSARNKIYWPGALLGIVAGAAYPVYYVGGLVLDAHPGQLPYNVLISQGFIYLVAAAAIIPGYIGSRVFEILLGSILQKHKK